MTTRAGTAVDARRLLPRRAGVLRPAAAALTIALALGACSSPTADEQLENREDSRVDADSSPSSTIKPVLPSAPPTGQSGVPTPDPVEPLPGPSTTFTPLPQASTTP